MQLLSWNVNGLRAVHKKGFLDWLKKQKPDILCLQETKCQPDQVPDEVRNVGGYTHEWHSAEKKGYSGTATFSKMKPLRVDRGFNIDEFDHEGRVLTTVYPEFVLFNIYFPNGKMNEQRLKFKMDFYEALLKVIDRYRKKGEDKIIICGDVNTAHKDIDLARPKENRTTSGFLPQECAWIDKFLSRGFVDTFREFEKEGGHYSWWDMLTRARERNVGWRIDYFLVSESLKNNVKAADIHPQYLGSDHCPVSVTLDM